MEIVAANDDQTLLERQVAEYAEQSRIDEAMALWIAKKWASPCVPHYEHMFRARDAVRYIREIAEVTPNIKRLVSYELLKQQKDD